VSHKVRNIAAGGMALVLLVVLGYLLRPVLFGRDEPPAPSGPCGHLIEIKGECVGVTEDPRLLHPELRGMVEKINEHNKKVEGTGSYVKVALLTPLSVAPQGSSAVLPDQVRYSVLGTLTALERANDTPAFGDQGVKIRLVLVNYGSRQEHRPELVDAILATSEPEHPLVAVVGLGSSFRGTEETATALAAQGIPMVGAIASANSLKKEDIPTLYSVSPSNGDYAQALLALLNKQGSWLVKKPDSEPALTDGIIVADKNDDPYVRTLRESIAEVLKPYVKHGELPFTGGTIDTKARPQEFDRVVTNLCNEVLAPGSKLRIVFYAGRVTDFQLFAEALEKNRTRRCKDIPLVVLVGATGFQAAQHYGNTLRQANITVIYATSADAPRWSDGDSGTPEGFTDFYNSIKKHDSEPADSLSDGYAIMYHDAMATAARAIRLAAQGGLPGPADVEREFGHLRSAYQVRAASGMLSFTRTDGRPQGKLVVYRQVQPATPYRLPANIGPYVM
jgi:hypothetical protein